MTGGKLVSGGDDMRKLTLVTRSAMALTLLAVLASCDKSPTTPTAQPPASTATPVRIDIIGPQSIAPGQSVQYTATQILSDGTSRDATNAVLNWSATPGAVLSVRQGLVTANTVGDAVVTAWINPPPVFVRGSKEVIVVPAGTYRLSGIVDELGTSPGPVVDARVEVIDGAAAGLSTTTGTDGRFRLYGVVGDTTIQITKDGYQTYTQSLNVADHSQVLTVSLPLVRPRLDFSGTYVLTITAAADCQLPDPVKTRTYTAVLTQQGPAVEAMLTGSNFPLSKNGSGSRFRGRVEPTRLVFSISQYSSYYYYAGPQYYGDLVEQLPDQTYLSIWGTVALTGPPGNLSGDLDGAFEIYLRDLRAVPSPSPSSRCTSRAHRFVLSR
jgi:hypothetical protein